MKRAQEDAPQETYLYWLPHELLIEILQMVFPKIGNTLRKTAEAFRVRETSKLIKLLMESELIGRVKIVGCYKTLSRMPDSAFSYLRGLRHLTLLRGVKVTNAGIGCLTQLESLTLSYTDNHFTSRCIEPLKCLRKLYLRNQASSAGKIDFSLVSSTLETLVLECNTKYSDLELSALSSLKTLSLDVDWRVTGECFFAMPKLDTLLLSGHCVLSRAHLQKTGSKFLELCLTNNTQVDDATLMQMTRLEKLSIIRGSNINYSTVTQLTNLRELSLPSNYRISHQDLSMLHSLKCFDLTF